MKRSDKSPRAGTQIQQKKTPKPVPLAPTLPALAAGRRSTARSSGSGLCGWLRYLTGTILRRPAL